MYTYTTPTLTCTLTGVTWANVELVRLALKGKINIVREIPVSEVDTETNTVTIRLTQEETANLSPGKLVVQARIKYLDGTVQASDKYATMMDAVIDKVVI